MTLPNHPPAYEYAKDWKHHNKGPNVPGYQVAAGIFVMLFLLSSLVVGAITIIKFFYNLI